MRFSTILQLFHIGGSLRLRKRSVRFDCQIAYNRRIVSKNVYDVVQIVDRNRIFSYFYPTRRGADDRNKNHGVGPVVVVVNTVLLRARLRAGSAQD